MGNEENIDITVGGTPQVADTATDEDESDVEASGAELYTQNCSGCHGTDGTGGTDAPGVINHVNDSESELLDIILSGFGRMNAIPITEEEALLIIEYMKGDFGT